MPELRKDPIVGRWVIISSDRSKRPTDFTREPVKSKGGFCPFCYGNESKTPPEVLAYIGPTERRETLPIGRCAWCPTSFRHSESKVA